MMNEQTLPENQEQPDDLLLNADDVEAIEDELGPESVEEAEAVTEFDDLPPLPPSFDIDAALAAIGSLSDVIAEREALEAAERARIEAVRQAEEERQEIQRREDEEYARWVASYYFARPPLTKLQRGQPASVIPGLLLIISGAYLTFALTLSDTPPAPSIVMLIVCGVVGITMLSHWISSGRWSRGALFAGLSLLFGGGILYYLMLPGGLEAGNGWPLLVLALGLTIMLSVILSKPLVGRLIPVGLAILIGGGVMLGFTSGALDPSYLTLINQFWFVPLIAAVFLMLIPVVRRG